MFALGENYAQSVQRAGGIPVMIPMGLSTESALHLFSKLSGIIFSGGGDVSPEFYNAPTDARIHSIDQDRDRQESLLINAAVEQQIPFLGICRGIQIINVALGGTLYADVKEDHPAALKHDYYPDYPLDHYAHRVSIQTGSILHSIFSNLDVNVNSLHHQGIHQLALGLEPIAFAPDGLVEAVVLKSHPFGLAVQWHPECLPEDTLMHALFASFIQASRKA